MRAVSEYDDLIRPGHRAHTVGNDQHRLILNQPGKRRLDQCLVLHIKACRRFIKQDNRRVLQERAGDGDALPLTA